MEPISREEAMRLLRLTPQPSLTFAQRERAREINALFDALADRTKIRERNLFDRTYPTPERAGVELVRFLHNVSECPQEVIDEAERLLKLKHEEELAKNPG